MMASIAMGVSTMKETKEKPKLSLRFPKDSKVQPKGFENANIGEEVTVVIKGPVISISENAEDWDPGKRFDLAIKTCEIIVPDDKKKVSIGDAVKAAAKKV